MLPIETNPKLDRQAFRDAVLLWRDREGGGREGLLVLLDGCEFPWGLNRLVDLDAYWVDEKAAFVEEDMEGLWAVDGDGNAEELRAAFHAAFDAEQGTIDRFNRDADPAAVTWICRELEGELGADVRRAIERGRAMAAPPRRKEPVVRTRPRVGRNEPCPCGSGSKYKRCCLAAAG